MVPVREENIHCMRDKGDPATAATQLQRNSRVSEVRRSRTGA